MMGKATCSCMALLATLFSGCSLVVSNDGGTIALTKDGRPASTIVIAKTANRSAQFAAVELRHHIEKITGAALPIAMDEDQVDGNRILVGESKATQALGLRGSDFKSQEYLIRFLPGTLVLMGKDKEDLGRVDYAAGQTYPGTFDEQATCFAVYDFLERYCGVRWYLPTDVGLVCPKEKTLSVKGADVRREPAMKYREMDCLTLVPASLCDEPGPRLDGRDAALFAHRQRFTGIQPFATNHAFYGYYKQHLKEHPEWFAKGYDKNMPEGMRNTPVENYDHNAYPMLYYPNMCYTNEGFIQQVIKRANEYFKTGQAESMESAAGDYFALGPMDSGGKDKMCQCAECEKLLHKEPPCNKWRKQPFFFDDMNSDYIFGFVNKVARGVGREHPGKYLTMFAYHQTYYPPTREPLEPNVAITFCMHALLRAAPAMDRALNDLLSKWDEESKERPKFLWLYFHRPGPVNPHFPGFMAHNMVKQMKDYHQRGFRGIFVQPPYFATDTPVKPGAANWAPIVNQLELYLAFKLADDPTLDGDKLIDEFFTLYYGAAAKPMQALYGKIEQVYCDPANYSFDPVNYFGYQTKEIAWGKLGTKERVAEFGKLMEAAKSAARTEMEKKRVEIFEKSVWERMKAGRREYESQEALKKENQKSVKSACATWMAGAAPSGDLDKVDWSQAGTLKGWGTLDGKPTDRLLEGRLSHDGQFLYARFQETMDTSKLVRHDDDVWNEDDWELFVGVERGKGYRQIGINAKGTRKALAFDASEKEWGDGVKVVSDTENPGCWVVLIALPLKSLSPGGVKPGQTIYLNVCRGTGGDLKKALSWSPTFSEGFHAPSQMGAILLADKAGVSAAERTEGE